MHNDDQRLEMIFRVNPVLVIEKDENGVVTICERQDHPIQRFFRKIKIRIPEYKKTSLDEFWEEAGGKRTEDYRFYELPVEEYRKSIDEIKTHKRSQYRNRFNKLDEVESKIIETIKSFCL